MVQCPIIFLKYTTEHSLTRFYYSKTEILILMLTAIYRQEWRSYTSLVILTYLLHGAESFLRS